MLADVQDDARCDLPCVITMVKKLTAQVNNMMKVMVRVQLLATHDTMNATHISQHQRSLLNRLLSLNRDPVPTKLYPRLLSTADLHPPLHAAQVPLVRHM